MTRVAGPTTADLAPGHLHTAIMGAIREDIVRQHPDAFTEDSDGEIVIPAGDAPGRLWVKIDVSALAEAALPIALSAKDAELEKAREALRPLARLEIPERRNGNAGFYSIYHSGIGNARQVLGETK